MLSHHVTVFDIKVGATTNNHALKMAGQSGWEHTHTGLDHRKSVGKPVKILMGATIGKQYI